MRPLLLILALLCTASFTELAAQDIRANGKISGIVIDSLTKKPVELANVVLLDATSNKPVNGNVCDDSGNFVVTKVAEGNYLLSISFIGYETKSIPVAISEKKNHIDVGSMNLLPSAKMLKEIEVLGQRALVEEKVDRMIYNAERDATAKGGDATDVLKRVPMLTVDADGNVSLKGSSSVRVLINNKPSTMTATSVADALKQIPSDMIKAVEVITSPSAKYDAEGSAGIINIVLKKNNVPGIFVTTDASAGTRGSNAGVNASYRQGKMGLSMGTFQRAQYNVVSDFFNTQTTRSNSDTVTNTQSSHNLNNGVTSQYTLDWDYDINKNNSLTVSSRYGWRNQNSYQNDLLTNTYQHDSLKSSSLRNVQTVNMGYTFDASVAYTKLFSKKNREFNFLGTYSKNTLSNGNGFISTSYQETDHSMLDRYKNENLGYNQEINLQLDYQEPIRENQLIEFGGKAVIRSVASNYNYLISEAPGLPFVPSSSASLSNNFEYRQNISAGYVSYTLSTKSNYSVKAGARYEYTTIDAFFQNQPRLDVPSYGVLVPTINISRKLSNDRMFRIAYNRRMVRPWLQALNPNLVASNSLNATIGNPRLTPEFADNYEIAYKTNIPKGTLNMSLYSRFNSDDIQPARIVRHDTIVAIYKNIGTEGNFGISIFASVALSNRFSINAGIDDFYRMLKNNSNDPLINATNSGLSQNYRLSGNYNFEKGWAVQFFTFFQGHSYNLQGYRTNVISHNLSVKKEIWKKAGTLGWGVENFVTPYFNVYSNLHSAYISQYTSTTIKNFIFKVNFSYKIGRKLPERVERKKLVEEEN